MTLLRALASLTLCVVVGCGDDSSVDAAIRMDAAGSTDAAGLTDAPNSVDVSSADAAGSMDAAAGEDGGGDVGVGDVGTDAAAADTGEPDTSVPDSGRADSGSACETRVEDRVAGVCDGIGMQICTNWASENGGMNAVAQCVRPEGRCARANTCTEDGCTCGREAECGDTEMCVSGVAGFSCVCVSPR